MEHFHTEWKGVDIALLAACKGAATIQMVTYESLV